MTIKSDKWIKKMAQNHKMIEPFTDCQIRNTDGNDLISYGTSSFGYDVRCATEFKVLRTLTQPSLIRNHLMRIVLSILIPKYA